MVRLGTIDDIPRCIELSHNFYKHTEYAEHIPLCENTCATHLATSIEQDLLAVFESDGVIQGFAMALAFPCLMNADYLVGAEVAWWVEPDHRGTSGVKILRFLEGKAKEKGIKLWSMMLLEAVEPEKVARIYEACGYTPAERTFLKVL